MTEGPEGAPVRARNAVVVLLESLNRPLLGTFGGGGFDTPDLDRFTARAGVLDRHQVGPLPCVPARHDLLCGALDFLWRPRGSRELREELDSVPGSDVPVIREPFAPGDPVPIRALGMRPGDHHCYDLEDDPGETRNRTGALADEMTERPRIALPASEAPAEQFARLRLS